MSFLAPLFILGLLGLIIPILVHLIQRDRKEVVRFPSLMFLEKVPYRSTRRQTIRYWWLFLIRSLAVALLAFAFARPLFEREGVAGAADRGPREVVVLLDGSYSMTAATRWDQAQAAARDLFNGLRPDDRATLIHFDEDARGIRRSESDPALLLADLEELQPGSEGTRLGPALRLAQSILETSDQPVREVHVISDFQQRAWTGGEEVALPTGTEVFPVPIGEGPVDNLAVAGVSFRRDSRQERERVTASARVVNLGARAVPGAEIRLHLGDRILQTVTVDFDPAGEAGATRAVEFDPFTVGAVDTRGRVSVGPDALPADDDFRFVLSPQSGLAVLIVEPRQRRGDMSLYLTRALEIGDDPGFRVTRVRADRLNPSQVEAASVVVFNGAGVPGPLVATLRGFVERGGGLLVILDEASTWPDDALDLLPGRFAGPQNRSGGALGWVDLDHPAFAVLGVGADFAAARIFRYRPVQPDSAADVVARFDDGAAALVERIGPDAGRVMLWATGVDNHWNDLALQPVYLPFMQRAVAYLAGVEGADPWHDVGASVDIAALWEGRVGRALADGEDWILAGPDGDPRTLALDGSGGAFARLEHQGLYEVRPAETGASGRWIAANADRAESNLTRTDPAEVAAGILAGTGAGDGEAVGPDARIRAADRERRQSLWWFLMAAVFGLLMLDTFVGNRLSRAPA